MLPAVWGEICSHTQLVGMHQFLSKHLIIFGIEILHSEFIVKIQVNQC